MTSYKVDSDMAVVDYPTRVAVAAEWLPVLGEVGFAMYATYACLQALKVEIGERRIAAHLNIGYTSLRRYNRLLVVCELVRIEPGNTTTPSRIVLREPRHVTAAVISDLYAAVLADELLNSTHAERFRSALFSRLENYKTLYQRLDPHTLALLRRPPQQEHIQTNGGATRPASPVVVPDRTSERIARAVGISGANVGLCATQPPEVLLAVALEAWGQPLKNHPGYIVSRLRDGQPQTGGDALFLARELLRFSRNDWAILSGAVGRWWALGEWELPEDFYPLLDEQLLDLFGSLFNEWGQALGSALGYE